MLDILDQTSNLNFRNPHSYVNEITKYQVNSIPNPISSYVQEKFEELHRKKTEMGMDYNKIIQNKKAFRNPSLYEKLILFCDIDELGESN